MLEEGWIIMGDKSSIQWCNRTWNPWQGCRRVSPGCEFCYMFRDKNRFGQDPEKVVRSVPQTFNRPHRWQKEAAAANRVDLVFTCSWSDWFIKEADPWRDEAWALVKKCPNLIFQILTKRPSRIAKSLPADWGDGYPNVWIGVSAENQDEFNRRVPLLLETPAAVRFVSVEPQIGSVRLSPIDARLRRRVDIQGFARCDIDWIIYGGESGSETTSRPLAIEWVRDGLRDCREAGIAPFVKQLGFHWARDNKAADDAGGDMAEWPEDLRIREFPRSYENDPRQGRASNLVPARLDAVQL